MRIFDYFDRAFIINLPHRKDRRIQMLNELKKIGVPSESDNIEFFSAIRPDEAGDFPSIGARGCFYSHLSVLRKAQKQGLNKVLIMEDDLSFSDDFLRHENSIVEQLKLSRWDFLYLGHPESMAQQIEKSGLIPISAEKGVMCTHFYCVNQVILNQLIDFLEILQSRPPGHPEGGPMHLDGAYSTFRFQNPNVVTLLAYPSLGGQRSSRSDITASKWFDRIPGIKDLANFVRIVKYDMRN